MYKEFPDSNFHDGRDTIQIEEPTHYRLDTNVDITISLVLMEFILKLSNAHNIY